MLTLIHPCPAASDLLPVRAQRRMEQAAYYHSAVPLDPWLRGWLARAESLASPQEAQAHSQAGHAVVVLGVPEVVYDEWIPGLHPLVEQAVRQGVYPLALAPEPPAAWDAWLDLGVPVAAAQARAEELDEAGYAGPLVTLEGGGLLLAAANPWESRLPLHGLRLVVTRAQDEAVGLLDRLQQLGARPLALPCLAFLPPEDPGPLQRALAELESYQWVIFTSANGVRFFMQGLEDVRRLSQARLAAIGPATAEELARWRLKADLVPPQFVAESLLEAFADQPMEGARVLLPRAAQARDVLPEGLRGRGAQVEVVAAYRSVAPQEPLPQELEKADLVLFTSSSTVRHFRAMVGDQLDLPVLAIGPVTAQSAREAGFSQVETAEAYTVEGMIKWLLASRAEPEVPREQQGR